MNPLFDKLCFYNVWNQKLLMITDSFLFGKDYLITMPRINVYRFFCAGQLSVTGEQIQKNKEPSAPGRNSPPASCPPPTPQKWLYNKHWLWSMKTSNASCNCNHPSIACATEHWTPTHFQDVSCLRGWVLVHRLHAKHNACTPQGVSLFSRTMFNVNTQLSETLWY